MNARRAHPLAPRRTDARREAAATAGAEPPAPAPAEDSRQRLLQAGLRLFAGQGFAQTSTRELAEAASVNVAAISYYFGDKAGLYRAAFFEPLGEAPDDLAAFGAPDTPLPQLLRGFYEYFLAPLRQGEVAALCMKIRLRETIEPTGLWDEEVARDIKPLHDHMAQALAERMGLPAPDLELQRLVVCLAGLGMHVHIGQDIVSQVAPDLNESATALDGWADALVRYSTALVHAEAARRGLKLRGENTV